VKVSVLSVAVVVGGIRGMQKVVLLSGRYGNVTDQLDPEVDMVLFRIKLIHK